MTTRATLCMALLAASTSFTHAEIVHGVEPFDSLGDIKKKFPNATVRPVKAVWVTEDKAFYRLSGEGFPGELYVAFTDGRPKTRATVAQLQKEAAEQTPPRAADTRFLESIIQQSDEQALTVDWVRWVPEKPIPLERYKSKYGEPAKCDFSADTMQPYCSWPSRALLVVLSDDKKMVLNAEAQFTRAEQRAAYFKLFGYVPDWLKEPSAAKEPTAVKERKPVAPPPR